MVPVDNLLYMEGICDSMGSQADVYSIFSVMNKCPHLRAVRIGYSMIHKCFAAGEFGLFSWRVTHYGCKLIGSFTTVLIVWHFYELKLNYREFLNCWDWYFVTNFNYFRLLFVGYYEQVLVFPLLVVLITTKKIVRSQRNVY